MATKKKDTSMDYATKKVGQFLLVLIMLPIMFILVNSIGAKHIQKEMKLVNPQRVQDYRYMYSFAILTNSEPKARRAVDLILSNCYEIGLENHIELVTHLVWKESRYNHKAVGYRRNDEDTRWIESDYGYFQICLDYNIPDIVSLTNVFPDINVKTKWGMKQALLRDDVNAYLGTRILKKRLTSNWGNIRLTLTAYNHGPYSKARQNLLHHGIGNEYEKSLTDTVAFMNGVKQWGWKLKDVEPPLHFVKL